VTRAWYLANRDRLITKAANWAREHPEKRRRIARQYARRVRRKPEGAARLNRNTRKSNARGNGAFNSWRGMKDRCVDPRAVSYRYYGARGITVCERWMVFGNFLADMGERPAGRTLDRINPAGNYEPGNCRWATRAEQDANRRH
jgi:hypothetical protein